MAAVRGEAVSEPRLQSVEEPALDTHDTHDASDTHESSSTSRRSGLHAAASEETGSGSGLGSGLGKDTESEDFEDASDSASEPVSETEEDAQEDAEDAQPFKQGRVGRDMATAAYDRSWTGATRVPPVPSPALRTGSLPGSGINSIPDEDSDAAIMLRVREGDDSCFTYLIEKYRKQIIHYMFRMTNNQAVAEELAQEVFLRVYRSRESYRAEAKFTTWLYRIATNLGVNHARDHKHEKAAHNVYLDQPDSETGTTPDVADSRLTAEQKLMRNERMAGIKAQVLALPERQRQAVLMHKYQDMDYREIGDVLKLSESATKSLLFRAYQTLRERLKDYV